MGNRPAVATANTVIASATRYTAVRNRARKRKRMAEISVPECAMPTQKTKSVINTPQLTGRLRPVSPMPKRMMRDQL